MASTKVANAHILIVPKFDDLGKETEKAMKEAARIGAAAFKNEFSNVAVDIVSDFKNIITKGTVSASYTAGYKSAKAFNTSFNESLKANSKISVVLEKDTTEAATVAGEKGAIKLGQALSGSSSKVAKESSKLGKVISSNILQQISSTASSVGNYGIRIGTSIINGIKTGLSRGASVIKSVFASIIPSGKSYGLSFSKQFLTGFRSGGVTAGITSAIAYTGIFTALSGVEEATSNAISRVDTLNNYPKVMQSLGYSTDEATASINLMESSLDGLPTALDDMTSVVSGYAAALGDLGQATDVGLAMNNMMLAGGQGTAVANSALEQFRQILTKGKPDLQDWKSLMMAAPGQMKQLAQAMLGVNATTDDLYAYIGGGVDDDTYKANIDTYSAHMQEFLNTIVELNETGTDGFTSFQEQAYSATAGIATSIELVKTRATKAVAQVINTIGQANIAGVIKQFSNAELAAGNYFSAMAEGIKETLDASTIGATLKQLASLGGVINTDTNYAKELGKHIGNFLNKTNVLNQKAVPIFKSLATAIKNMVVWMGNNSIVFFTNMAGVLADHAEDLEKSMSSLGKMVTKYFPSDGSGMASWGTAFGDALVLGINSVPTLVDDLDKLIQKFNQTFDLPGADDFVTLLSNVLNFANDAINGFTDAIDFNEFKTMFTTYAEIFGDTFNNLFNTDGMTAGQMLGAVFAGMANSIAKLATSVSPIVDIFSDYIVDGLKWLKENMPGIVTSIQQFMNGFSSTIDFNLLGDAVTTFASSLADGLGVNSDLSDAERNGVAFATVLNDLFYILKEIAPYGKYVGEIIKYIAENIEWLVPTVLGLIVACKGLGALGGIISTISGIKNIFGSSAAETLTGDATAKSAYNLVDAVDEVGDLKTQNPSFEEFFKKKSVKENTEDINFADETKNQSIFEQIKSKFEEFFENIKTKVSEFATSIGDTFKEKVLSKFSEFTEEIKTKFTEFSEDMKTKVSGFGTTISDTFKNAFSGIGEKFESSGLKSGLEAMGTKLTSFVADGALDKTITAAGSKVLPVLGWGSLIYDMADLLQTGADAIFGKDNFLSQILVVVKAVTWVFKQATDILVNGFLGIVTGFANFMTHIGDYITAPLKDFADQCGILDYDLGNLPEDLKNAFVNMFKSIGDSISGAFDSAKTEVGNWFNGVGNWWNENVHLPQFANGGVVSKPTLSLIGEGNSSEAVLPLNNSTYDSLAQNISKRQTSSAASNDDLLNGIKDLIGSMQINLDGKTLGRVSAPYNDRALGSRGNLARRGVAI